ncbi:MAG: toll/interleukin-1 receptor domain-containing protein [Verrucomicrobiota bacterium JB022]|nr:toll/interleukin-1 receptor domain-containing protein [Verrucomicrobiota bacterium JB022]
MNDEREPTVFISYSHDSKPHKQWVLELAQKLRREEINVIIDQWDLEPGEDLSTFMNYWVRESDRVLLICTETYVQKADDGKGGAGYEAMIVTSELMEDLGSTKFIPVIRQAKGSFRMPQKMGLRFAINLSETCDEAQENLETLVGKLHQEPPPTKPPLGVRQRPQSHLTVQELVPAQAGTADTPESAFTKGLQTAQQGDTASWRRLISGYRSECNQALTTWREVAQQNPPHNERDLITFATRGLSCYQKLFAATLGGIDTDREPFSRHNSLIMDLLNPRGWEHSGLVVLVYLPETATWLFQALAGAMFTRTQRAGLAMDLVSQRVQKRHTSETSPLFLLNNIIGWPKSLGESCSTAWKYLYNLPDVFGWVKLAFGDDDSFKISISSHYLMLSWMEFIAALKSGEKIEAANEPRHFSIPPQFAASPDLMRSATLLLESRSDFQQYAERAGVSQEMQKRYWANWIHQIGSWQWRVHHYYSDNSSLHHLKFFTEDIYR